MQLTRERSCGEIGQRELNLCENIRESEEDIIRIVTKTTDDVTNAKGTFQQPLTVFTLGTKHLKKLVV